MYVMLKSPRSVDHVRVGCSRKQRANYNDETHKYEYAIVGFDSVCPFHYRECEEYTELHKAIDDNSANGPYPVKKAVMK